MNSNTQDLCDQIRKVITDEFMPGSTDVIGDDDSLVDMGYLDSLQIVELVLALEKKLKVRVRASDITVENFGTISNIASYVTRLQSTR